MVFIIDAFEQRGTAAYVRGSFEVDEEVRQQTAESGHALAGRSLSGTFEVEVEPRN